MGDQAVGRAVALVACGLALALGGCGGGDDGVAGAERSDRAEGKPAITEQKALAVQESLLGDGGSTASAGDEESYEPAGEIVADSGFRPWVDGFSFENYGNDVEPQNLTSAEIQALFGDDVCVGGDGEDCKLTPAAERWMETQNARMDGGHCMGFSVAAIRMFVGALEEKDFGADTTAELEIQGNTDLQASIAEHWVYQDLPGINEQTFQGTPTETLDRLAENLNSGEENFTIGIFKPDGTAGHAITPFAVEDKGDDEYAVLVYDNNFPGIVRALDVDVAEDTWSYVGGTNPKDLDQVYKGNAKTQSMILLPTSPGENLQPCPFCQGEDGEAGEGFGASLGKDQQYSQITLNGDVENHPHLILMDEQERVTGIVDGELVNEIPGVEVEQSMSVRNWEAAPEPAYLVPAGRDLVITVDGSQLERRTKASLELVAGGLVVAVDEIKIEPGQQDQVALSGDGNGLYYETDGTNDETPEFYAGVDDDDASYTFAATAVGVKRGSTIGLVVDQESGTVLLDADGAKASVGDKAYFVLLVGKETPNASRIWGTDSLRLSTRRKEGAYFNYRETPKAGRSLKLEVGPEDGPLRTVKAPYQR